MEKKTKKLLIIGIVILAVLVAAFAIIWGVTRPETSQGAKEVIVIVDYGNDTSDTFEIDTDAEFLREAIEEEVGLEGDESEFGLFIRAVNGVAADESLQQWWCITKGGESVMSGVDTTPIEDGDQFELTLTTGW
ncbi:MAG: DUF4430 domain-containing protein [Clostridia bacterium]|nr:DUF4430 domain-containing protein [Clostridia bacterium]